MSLEVLDQRKLAIHDVGLLLDDALESLRKDEIRFEGAVQALQEAAKHIEGLMKKVEQEMDEGKLDIPQQVLAKKWLMEAHTELQRLEQSGKNNLLICRGKVSGMEQAVGRAKKLYDVETAKQTILRRREGGPEETIIESRAARAAGEAPGASLKQRRLAEEQAAAPDEDAPSAAIAATPAAAVVSAESAVVAPLVAVAVPTLTSDSSMPSVSDPRVARALKRVRAKR